MSYNNVIPGARRRRWRNRDVTGLHGLDNSRPPARQWSSFNPSWSPRARRRPKAAGRPEPQVAPPPPPPLAQNRRSPHLRRSPRSAGRPAAAARLEPQDAAPPPLAPSSRSHCRPTSAARPDQQVGPPPTLAPSRRTPRHRRSPRAAGCRAAIEATRTS